MLQNEQFSIRLGALDDSDNISGVFSDSVRILCKKDYGQDMLERWISAKSSESRKAFIKSNCLWIAEVNGELAAYLISTSGEIIALFVHFACSGLGIGLALARLGIKVAQQEGAKRGKA